MLVQSLVSVTVTIGMEASSNCSCKYAWEGSSLANNVPLDILWFWQVVLINDQSLICVLVVTTKIEMFIPF